MKLIPKILILSVTSAIICQAAFALSHNDNNAYQANDYSVVALKDCEIISSKAMTTGQFDAYTRLKQQEQAMHTLEKPTQDIEHKMDVYADKIERLTKLAIQETDDTLHINKKLLKQQDAVAKEFAQFMQLHQHKFDALGDQGKAIGQQAKIFETSIKDNLENIDYDQIYVLTPDSHHSEKGCDNNISVMVL
jgi:hypothetical protein